MISGDQSSFDAEAIVAALKGKWLGNDAMCRCPAHADGTPSLSVSRKPDGVVLLHCFAGCDFRAIADALGALGLGSRRMVEPRALTPETVDQSASRKRRWARAMWDAAVPIDGTLGEVYLRARRIGGPLPSCLRYLRSAEHHVSRTMHPAVIAAVHDSADGLTAIQRIYVSADGRAKAGVEPAKPSLGPMGDGAVRLAAPGPLMGLAEGVETALSAARRFSLPVWASLGAGRLPAVWLPEECREVVIFADNGNAGIRQAKLACAAFREQGRRVAIEAPPEEFSDWNDVATGRAA